MKSRFERFKDWRKQQWRLIGAFVVLVALLYFGLRSLCWDASALTAVVTGVYAFLVFWQVDLARQQRNDLLEERKTQNKRDEELKPKLRLMSEVRLDGETLQGTTFRRRVRVGIVNEGGLPAIGAQIVIVTLESDPPPVSYGLSWMPVDLRWAEYKGDDNLQDLVPHRQYWFDLAVVGTDGTIVLV